LIRNAPCHDSACDKPQQAPKLAAQQARIVGLSNKTMCGVLTPHVTILRRAAAYFMMARDARTYAFEQPNAMIDAKPSGSSERQSKVGAETGPGWPWPSHHPLNENREYAMTANPAQNRRKWTLRLIVRLTVLVVVAFGIPGRPTPPRPTRSPSRSPIRASKVGSVAAAFTVTAATLPLADDKGENRPIFYYVAYTRDEAASGSRPITLSSMADGLQLGLSSSWRAGPRVIDFGSDGQVLRIAGHMAVARADRSTNTRSLSPASCRIVTSRAGRPTDLAIGPEIDDPRSQRAKMKIGRAGARSAIGRRK